MRPRSWAFAATSIALLVATALGACPSTRTDPRGGVGDDPLVISSAFPLDPANSARATEASPIREETIVAAPLSAGVALARDPIADDLPIWAIDVTFDVGWIDRAAPAPHPPQSPASLRATLAHGRARLDFGGHALGLEERTQLRAAREKLGFLVVPPASLDRETAAALGYRVVPPGALRPYVLDRRIDVLPLVPTQVSEPIEATRAGRAVTRVSVKTAYGSLELDQIVAPQPTGSAARKAEPIGDAGAVDAAVTGDAIVVDVVAASAPSTSGGGATLEAGIAIDPPKRARGLEGAGESLCRFFVELVGADRALTGAPCAADRVPIHAELTFAGADRGGLRFSLRDLREREGTALEVAFPPRGAHLLAAPAGPPTSASLWVDAAALLAIHPRGDAVELVLVNRASQPRVVSLDDLAIAWIPPAIERSIGVRAGRYRVEWRTPLGEIVDRAVDVDAPGRATSSPQFIAAASSSSSTAPIASARNGP